MTQGQKDLAKIICISLAILLGFILLNEPIKLDMKQTSEQASERHVDSQNCYPEIVGYTNHGNGIIAPIIVQRCDGDISDTGAQEESKEVVRWR